MCHVSSRARSKTLNLFESQQLPGEAMLSASNNDLRCTITGDETWIYAYDPETA